MMVTGILLGTLTVHRRDDYVGGGSDQDGDEGLVHGAAVPRDRRLTGLFWIRDLVDQVERSQIVVGPRVGERREQ